uniref:Bulb-type lectin domain-containing protein n=1 Tax=Salix viminalis TaxID=40686 RepID=A0A6N2MJV7_SALVM
MCHKNSIAILCFCFTSFFITSFAEDTISANQTIRHRKTIVSSSPGCSKQRYLGIWCNKISKGNVVWMANREIPITDSRFLKFDERGVLTLLDQNSSVIWSSNTSKQRQKPVAQLLDSGMKMIVALKNFIH